MRTWLDHHVGPLAFTPANVALSPQAPAVRETLARILGCPDLFLVDAGDSDSMGLLQAFLLSIPNSRVLVLTADAARANRILELTTDRGIRALAPNESIESIPEPLRPSTTTALIHAAETRLKHEHERQEQARSAIFSLRTSILQRTAILTRQNQECERLQAEHEAKRQSQERRHAEARAHLATERAALSQRLESLRAAKATMLSEQAGGLLNRLFHRKKSAEHDAALADLERQILELQEDEFQLQQRGETLLQEQANEKQRFATSSPASACAAARAKDAAELQSLGEAIAQASENLTRAGWNLSRTDGFTIPTSIAELDSMAREIERCSEISRQNREATSGVGTLLARGLLGSGAVVVGPIESQEFEEALADAVFDWLWLETTPSLEEDQALAALRRSTRRVLVRAIPPAQARFSQPSLDGNGIRFSKGDPVVQDVFARLASRLDQESWCEDGDRLIRRLHPLDADVEREPLLDRPEIELHFGRTEANELELKAVSFPHGTSAAEAKAFLFVHLGDVSLRPIGESHTHDLESEVIVRWPAVDRGDEPTTWVPLEPGVREQVLGSGAHAFTAAVSFDRAHGWTAERAAAWLADHLPSGSPSRVAVLPCAREAVA